MEPDALQKQADHCNDRRMASKRVQELSASLFFAVLVKVRPPPWRPAPPRRPTSSPRPSAPTSFPEHLLTRSLQWQG